MSASWSLMTNHAHVLLALHRDPEARQRDIARVVGITESSVQRIISDLTAAKYLRAERNGRRNRYEIDVTAPLRHPSHNDRPIRVLVETFADRKAHPSS